MATDPARVKALFQAAIELDDPGERRALLDRAAGDDAELRARLDVLLAAHDLPPGPLDRPLGDGPQAMIDAGTDATRDAPTPVPGPTAADGPGAGRRVGEGLPPLDSVIAGRYKLRQEIGEGGMGSVYLAEQTAPVRRMVAVKLIKPGMDSRTVLARFESERQALALMDHPNIARVLDAGTTEQGRPFFVMELVKGIPVTGYCDQHHLGISERLGLFRQICSAVQHAHQKGIIHRDLKPTNILVESHDGRPVPKVIDFGLAKATSGMRLSEHSLFTAPGSVAGTPLYMPPEQAMFNALDVDTRADIYALGVILYELLTGSTPIRKDTLQRAALDEMLRVIREDEPPTPSSRISTSDGLPGLAAARHVEPARLSRLIRGDLDWIVMKALAKERERRYESAIGLGNDVERFLNHEPVSAGPPTAAYRLRKFVRRNRPQVATAALLLLALVVGVAGTTLGLLEARRQARRAEAQEAVTRAEAAAKEQARRAEAEQRRQAEARLGQVAKMNEILGSIFRDLNPKDAATGGKPLSAILGERLDLATAAIEGGAVGDPLAVARMQIILGGSQLGLGYPEKAVTLFAKARSTYAAGLGPDHPDTLASMNDLVLGYRDACRLDDALRLSEEVLARRRATLGPDHLDTLASMYILAMNYHDAGRHDEALRLREEVLAAYRTKLGPDHRKTLAGMHNVAYSYLQTGRYAEALRLLEEVLARQKATLGPDHPDTLASMIKLAFCYSQTARLDDALRLSEEALARRRATLGPDHLDTLASIRNLATHYHDAGRRDEALRLSEEVLAAYKTKLGPDHRDTIQIMNDFAFSHRRAGRHAEAPRLYEEALAAYRTKLGPDHPDTLGSMSILAFSYGHAGRLDEALRLGEEALAAQRAKLGPDHRVTIEGMIRLANSCRDAGRLDRGEALAHEAVSRSKALPGETIPYVRAPSLTVLSRCLLDQKKWAEAELSLRELLPIREAQEPDTWFRFHVRSLLGAALVGQGRSAEAEPLLRSGYEGLARLAAKSPTRERPLLAEALDRLIAWGEAAGKADEVKAWKAERARLGAAAAPRAGTGKK